MALSITVNGGGTFSASMEEGPVSFTATLGAVPGPKGDTGATGPTGVIAATAPILYNSGTQTVSIDPDPSFTSVTVGDVVIASSIGIDLGGLDVTGVNSLTFNDATTQTTAFVGEARKVYVTARNNSGSTIAAGKVVYLSGATGNKPTIALAQANAEATSARVIGLTVESIANNADGKVIISGSAENIDTSAFNAGDVVYLSATTAGGMTTTLPTQPYHGVAIGIITRANPSVGSVEVSINNYQELEELSDVLITSKANLDLLSWDSASSTWQNKTFSTLGLLTSATAASTYLTQSNAASTYAPIASPTFTGTVTIPAGASISGYLTTSTAASTYAPLASPTFTGDPKAPTPATSDNDTSVATTAFVNAYCPAASTTVAGKVELATEAEARAVTSTTLAVNPQDLRTFYQTGWFIPDISASTAVTATGTTFVSPTGINTRIIATASGQYAIRYFGTSGLTVLGWSPGSGVSVCNFSRLAMLTGLCALSGAHANITNRIKFGISGNPTGPGDLATKGFGIRIVGTGALELQVHNGTTLTNVTSSFTPSPSISFRFLITSDGSGNVELFVDSGSGFSSVATTSAGPTGNSASYPLLSQETESFGAGSGSNTLFYTQQLAYFLA